MHLSKTAVVGLLPAQAQKIAKDFPRSGLKFVPRDREREVSTITGALDHVLIMTKFISHTTWHSIPREKVTPVNGGLSDLRNKLRKLERVLPPVPVERPESLELPDMADADYSAIKFADPGQVLVYKRPSNLSMATFEKQVAAARSYYKRKHSIETEQKPVDQTIHITVNGKLDKTPPVEPTPAPTPAPIEATETVRRLWADTYVSFVRSLPGAPDEALAARADAAVAAYRERFG